MYSCHRACFDAPEKKSNFMELAESSRPKELKGIGFGMIAKRMSARAMTGHEILAGKSSSAGKTVKTVRRKKAKRTGKRRNKASGSARR